MTNVELAGEDPGYVPASHAVSEVGFFNNTFGQGLLVTPLQMAAAYGAIVHSGIYMKPTILNKLCEQ